MVAVRRPAEPEGTIGLVEQYLKHPVPRRGLWNDLTEPLMQKIDLLHTHVRCPAPVGPPGLVVFVIVTRRQVDYGVYEAQNHAVCGPVDHDVHRHVVGVHRYLIRVLPRRSGPLIPQLTPHTRQPRVTDAG